MGLGRTSRLLACCAASALALGVVGTAAPAFADSGRSHSGGRDFGRDHGGDGHDHGAIFVSPNATTASGRSSAFHRSSGPGKSCDSATFSSISAAVAAAPTGGTVVVCPGTYQEDVIVNKALNLLGLQATIDATGRENGIQVVASNVRVDGFTVNNANGEGILVGIDSLADIGLLPASGPVLSHVAVEDSVANNNDKGFNFTETGNCKYPGDCGGGIHLNGTTQSVVRHDTVDGNADGILLTDDYAPSSYNLVADNVVDNNLHECGIVLPSHASNAVTFDPTTFKVTSINPTLGGVYNNVVVDNVADGNGTDKAPPQFGGGGSGSGIGLFASGPGSAVYNNLVVDNEASGNGLAGIAMHAHHPGGEVIDGNVLVHNNLGTNNIGGDGFDGPPVMDFQTTGIAIFSAVPAHMVIADNKIHDDAIGIWLSTTITADGLSHNHYKNVTTPVTGG